MRILDAYTGDLLLRRVGHRGTVHSFAFSTDGRKLATISEDTTGLIWDLHELLPKRKAPLRRARAELLSLWDDLAGADGIKAYQAIGKLATAPDDAAPFLREGLRPVPAFDTRRFTELLRDLESDQFAVRQRASADIEALGGSARPALQKALTDPPSLEFRQRVQSLLTKLDERSRPRELRALEALERMRTPVAGQLLQTLAKGAAGATLTQEAKASLQRMQMWSASP